MTTNEYILESIHWWVWSGYYTAEDVDGLIDELLEEDADEALLRAAVKPEFDRKHEAEKNWPVTTDCDRLEGAFKRLDQRGILCLENAGFTMSDGHEDALEALSQRPKEQYFGYCFFHGQDLQRAVEGAGLMLAFDHVKGDVPDKIKVAQAIKEELEVEGFEPDWNGTSAKRISIPGIDWKRRLK